MTYNVRSCVGMDGSRSYTRIAEVIMQTNPDVVALQELDVSRPRSRNAHQARIIASLLRMTYHFHPALRIREEEYGDAILTRHPVRLIQARELPSPGSRWLEPRGAIWVNVFAEGVEWQIINTHFGLLRFERLCQARTLTGPEWLERADPKLPLAVCGDLNSRTGSPVHRIFRGKLTDVQTLSTRRPRATFSTSWPLICLDYILVNEGVGVTAVDVIDTPATRLASDHFPLVADLTWSG